MTEGGRKERGIQALRTMNVTINITEINAMEHLSGGLNKNQNRCTFSLAFSCIIVLIVIAGSE